MRKTLLALALPFMLSAFGRASSFDCAKAATAQEKAICASPGLSKADDQMAAAYKAWLAAAPSQSAAAIRQNQLAWLHERDAECPALMAADLGSCLTSIYKLRISDLQGMVQHVAGLTFVAEAITLTARDTPDTAPPPGAGEFTPGFGTFEAAWPQASASAPQWIAWNSALVPAILQVANADEETTAKDWNGLVQPGVDRDLSATVDRVNAQWVSVHIVDFYDGHGAHPMESTWQFYWLLGGQRALQPEDVFLPNSGWDTWMEQRLDAYLHKTLDSESGGNYQAAWFPQGDAAQTLKTIVTSPRDWTLAPAGLSLFFQPYQVACYACTPQPLSIPWSDLKPYLQPGFVLPQN